MQASISATWWYSPKPRLTCVICKLLPFPPPVAPDCDIQITLYLKLAW